MAENCPYTITQKTKLVAGERRLKVGRTGGRSYMRTRRTAGRPGPAHPLQPWAPHRCCSRLLRCGYSV